MRFGAETPGLLPPPVELLQPSETVVWVGGGEESSFAIARYLQQLVQEGN